MKRSRRLTIEKDRVYPIDNEDWSILIADYIS